MDWLRRNWPDLIIGVALVAVVALIVVTLLGGGSLASLVRRDTPPEPITETTPDTGTATPANTTEGAAGSSTQATGNGASSTGNTGVDVFVPGVPGGQVDTAGGASGGQAQANTAANTAPGGAGAQTASGGVVQGSQANAAGGPLPEATQDGGFRVAAGAVDSRESAASLAESFREAGYTVTVEQQGELYLLWVGPYATREGADRVAARLQTDGLVPDALVYSYDGPDSSTASSGSNPGPGSSSGGNAAAGNATNTATAEGTATQNTATSENAGTASTGSAADNAAANTTATGNTATSGATGQRYLQVGAFTSDEDAQPLREQLEALGFSVTRSVSDEGLIRLLVGPFSDVQLFQTQTRLTGEGIPDAFPVTP